MIKMKCDSCKFQVRHEPYTHYDIFCSKGNWSGEDSENCEEDLYIDSADNCEDFESEGE